MPRLFFRRWSLLMLLAGTAMVPVSVVAEPPVQPSTPDALKQEWADLVTALAEVERDLLMDDAPLAAMHRRFRRQILQAMQDNGYPAMTVMRRLHDIRDTLERLEPGSKRHQRLAQSYERQSRELLGAQRRAMRDPKILKARRVLLDATLNTMRERSEQGRMLLERIGQIRSRVTSMEQLALGPGEEPSPARSLTPSEGQR